MTSTLGIKKIQHPNGTNIATLDSSGSIAFAGASTVGGTLGVTGIGTFTDDIVIGDGKTIGSASKTDAITIASSGLTQLRSTGIGAGSQVFQVIDDGATLFQLRAEDGNISFPQSGAGIYLGVTSGNSANLLNDYEEGSWTPAFNDAGGGTFGYAAQSGTYTKIGRLVYCQFNIVVNSVSGLSGSILRITGQPFSSNSDENMFVSRYQGFTGGAPHRGNASGSSSVNMKSEGTNDNGNFPSNRVTSSTQLIGQIMFTAS